MRALHGGEVRTGWCLICLACLTGCEQDEVFYEPSDPRPAASTEATTSPSIRLRISPESRVTFELASREQTTRGQFPLVRGELSVPLADLTAATGRVEVDLGALRLTDLEDDAEARLRAERARNWLNLGASRPEAVRERARWAGFTLATVNPSAVSVYQARRSALALPSSEAGAGDASKPAPTAKQAPPARPHVIAPRAPGEDVELPEPEESSDEAAPSDAGAGERRRVPEQRTLRAVLSGQLTLNQFRKELQVEVSLAFEFPDRAAPGVAPTRVLVTSVKPLRVSLSDFAIEPRDAHGVVDASQAELKRRAGSEARVSLALVLEPQ
ncbi:MAG: hypothetical protein KF915_19980 [Polyangiaceae bacterium]|nr:hypothetical protein [Polyangiaceae bacterium]